MPMSAKVTEYFDSQNGQNTVFYFSYDINLKYDFQYKTSIRLKRLSNN